MVVKNTSGHKSKTARRRANRDADGGDGVAAIGGATPVTRPRRPLRIVARRGRQQKQNAPGSLRFNLKCSAR